MIQDGWDDSRWFKMIPDESRWFEVIQDDSRWLKMCQDVSRWLKMIQDDSRLFRDGIRRWRFLRWMRYPTEIRIDQLKPSMLHGSRRKHHQSNNSIRSHLRYCWPTISCHFVAEDKVVGLNECSADGIIVTRRRAADGGEPGKVSQVAVESTTDTVHRPWSESIVSNEYRDWIAGIARYSCNTPAHDITDAWYDVPHGPTARVYRRHAGRHLASGTTRRSLMDGKTDGKYITRLWEIENIEIMGNWEY